MRKLIVSEFTTLDGVIEDPGGAEKSKYGGWSFPFWNEEAAKFKQDELFAGDALLLGRVTYQAFAAAWPSRKDEEGFADRMNGLPKYVASRTLAQGEWNNTTVIKEDVPAEVAKLKQQAGQPILIFGSGQLIQTLIQHDMVDEYRLMVHPVVVGGGKRLFRDGLDRKSLRLVDSKAFKTGITVLTYEARRFEQNA